MSGVKNKKHNMIISAAVALIILVTTLFSALHTDAATETLRLYLNDENWYNEYRYPLKEVDGVMYVPSNVFNEFEGISVVTDVTMPDNFVISNSNNGKYVSFNTRKNIAQDEQGNVYEIVTWILYGLVVSVPMKTVCSMLGLKIEEYKNNETGKIYYRICDGKETLSFVKLLEIYNPKALNPEDITSETTTAPQTSRPTETTKNTDTTKPPVTETTKKEVDTKKPIDKPDPIYVYLSFDASPNEYTDEILDLLYRYNCAATFFLTSEGIKSHPNLVLRMISEGHAIGVSTEDGSYNGISTLNDLVASFDSVNNTLYRLAKMKTHIARAPGGCASDYLFISSADASTVATKGYILWDWNIEAYDGVDSKYSAKTAYKKIIKELEEIISNNKNSSDNHSNIPVIRFSCTDTTADILELLLEYIYNSKAFVTKVISIYEKEINNAS